MVLQWRSSEKKNPWSTHVVAERTHPSSSPQLRSPPPLAVRGGSGLVFIVIHNLVRSWSDDEGGRLTPPNPPLVFVCRSLPGPVAWSESAGRTCVGSPDVGRPGHLHRVGVGVDLLEGGGGRRVSAKRLGRTENVRSNKKKKRSCANSLSQIPVCKIIRKSDVGGICHLCEMRFCLARLKYLQFEQCINCVNANTGSLRYFSNVFHSVGCRFNLSF